MPGQSPLRHGTGEGVGYHRRARGEVQSWRSQMQSGRPGGFPRHGPGICATGGPYPAASASSAVGPDSLPRAAGHQVEPARATRCAAAGHVGEIGSSRMPWSVSRRSWVSRVGASASAPAPPEQLPQRGLSPVREPIWACPVRRGPLQQSPPSPVFLAGAPITSPGPAAGDMGYACFSPQPLWRRPVLHDSSWLSV